MNDLIMIYLCCSQPATGTLNIVPTQQIRLIHGQQDERQKDKTGKEKYFKKQTGKHCIIFQRLFLEYIIKAQQSG